MKTFNLFAMLGLLVFGLTANAKVNTSKIVCTYNSATNNPQTVTFEAPAGVDLSVYPPPHNTVPLKINGSPELTIFQVTDFPTHVGVSVVYSLRHPIFISDITITYSVDQLSGINRLSGTWTVDHPPVRQLNCDFSEASDL